VKDLVHRIRTGVREFFSPPDGYEVVLGNGGATLFWDVAVHNLILQRSAHAVFGEFSTKFARASAAAPFLSDPVIVESPPGSHPTLTAAPGVDAYALTHCETSTGVAMPVHRPGPGLVLVDATSAAGGIAFDPADCDAYYFSPQKAFASEGGLWLALVSPAAVERAGAVRATGRHIPASLDLGLAVENSLADQTYNTPAIATLFLLAQQVDALNERGGLPAAAKDCAEKAGHLYAWAEASDHATPFVAAPEQRSPVVCTIDFDGSVSADALAATLRANGIVDTEAYRKLGRNQLRIAVFPSVDLDDVRRLTAAIDYLVERLHARP
jgi:phosphoserine aminotransferase